MLSIVTFGNERLIYSFEFPFIFTFFSLFWDSMRFAMVYPTYNLWWAIEKQVLFIGRFVIEVEIPQQCSINAFCDVDFWTSISHIKYKILLDLWFGVGRSTFLTSFSSLVFCSSPAYVSLKRIDLPNMYYGLSYDDSASLTA